MSAARNRLKRERKERDEMKWWDELPLIDLLNELADNEDHRPVFHDHRAFVIQQIARRFKVEYELTDAEFAEDHWQTLFAIQYPEVRP